MSFVSTGEWARDSMLSMSKTFRPWDVDQVWLLPPSVQDLVPAGAGHGSQRAGFVGDHGRIWRGPWVPALPSRDDDGAVAVRLQPRALLVATDREGVRGAA